MTEQRFLFGWNPTRQDDQSYGKWHWGGNIVVHELIQAADGSLGVRVPESVSRLCSNRIPVAFTRGGGDYALRDDEVAIEAPHSFAYALAENLQDQCRISMSVEFLRATQAFGLMLRADRDGESAYFVRFEPWRNRLVFDAWPRPGDLPHMAELERPLALTPGTPLTLEVLIDDTVCEIYAAGHLAMSARLYPLLGSAREHGTNAEGATEIDRATSGSQTTAGWGVFVAEGAATFSQIRLFVR